MSQERHARLLEALAQAKSSVTSLERELARSAALLGIGVDPTAGGAGAPSPYSEKAGYLQAETRDISDYLGIEGDDRTRPRLGPDAPVAIRPKTEPGVNPLVHQLAERHPDEALPLDGGPLLSPPGQQAAEPAMSEAALQPAEPAMSEAEHLRLAVDVLEAGFLEWEPQTQRVFADRRWEALMGPGAETFPNPVAWLTERMQAEDGMHFAEGIATLLSGQRKRFAAVVRLRSPSGHFWGRLTARVQKDPDGVVRRLLLAVQDAGTQRETELALRISEEKFRSLAGGSSDVIMRFDAAGRILYAGPSIERYMPVRADKLVGKNLSDFRGRGDFPFFMENVLRVFEMGLPIETELTLLSPLAGEIVADCRFWPEFGQGGEVLSVVVQMRDMTFSRRMAENYHALFNSMVDGFLLFEPLQSSAAPHKQPETDFVILAANPAIGKMFNRTAESLVGHRLSDLFGNDAPQASQILQKALDTRAPVQMPLTAAERRARYELSIYSPEQRRVACIVRDVTEVFKFERELRLNEARFAALYRLTHMDEAPEEEVVRFSLHQAVHLTGSSVGYLYLRRPNDERGRGLIFWSHARLDDSDEKPPLPPPGRLLPRGGKHDIRRAEIVNRPVRDFPHPVAGRPVTRHMLAPVIEEDGVSCLAAVAEKEGSYTLADLRQLELFINGMWYLLRRRWSLQALQKAKEDAEAANRAKNEFLANVSHELRTPLNGILGMLQLLQQSPLTREQTDWVVTAGSSGRSLLRVISDILDLSRIEAGKLELAAGGFDLSATLRSTLGMFLQQAGEKHLNFDLRLDANIPLLLLGDDARVRQIIFNLVGNAFKFTEQGSILVECSLLRSSSPDLCRVYLAVHDTGIGVPEERIDDMFQAFTQLDGSSTRRYAGTGLGLGIVRRLVQLMNGSLCIESEQGVGTSVHLSLPFGRVEAAVPVIGGPEAPPPQGRPLDILLAEDDPVNRLMIKTLLSKAGHTVTCVNDGRQALEALLLHPYDCLLTDIQMPEMDGVELVGRIRQGRTEDVAPSAETRSLMGVAAGPLRRIPQDIPIVALTAHAMTGDKERFLTMGMDHYLSKPISAEQLRSVLNHVAALLEAKNRQ